MDPPPPLPAALIETLAIVADPLRAARDPWWIIGSAAVALHGARPIAVRDVDVLLSPADARAILPAIGIVPARGRPDTLFRSTLFARATDAPLPVEWMAGLSVRAAGRWRPVRLATRETGRLGDMVLAIPARAELRRLLRLFGRPKDRRRARLLAQIPDGACPSH